MRKTQFAHSLEGAAQGSWQPLDEHLLGVARLAETFGESFGGGLWARLAGLWHDLGKSSEAYQGYLRASAADDMHRAELRGTVDHSSAGARHAVEQFGPMGHLLAFVIAGHHAGLHDALSEGACLRKRMDKILPSWDPAMADLRDSPTPKIPESLQQIVAKKGAGSRDKGFVFALFARMIFSCLVDADFLNTEAFMAPELVGQRPAWSEDLLARMEHALTTHIDGFKNTGTVVDCARTQVRAACLDKAASRPGLFSLTVPTGGGKTLSSLAFALRHAIEHRLERVIYVIPFTSIIEQNAEVFRRAMGDMEPSPVVEHHSNLDVGEETETSRLASENWDAPLVVTTSVQFYESLFASRTSRCRKLHNLARSVIILDEVQTLPTKYLAPCLKVLGELTRSYGATVVLCTATQPAVHERDNFSIGLSGVREIIPDPKRLYRDLKRVEVQEIGEQTDEELAGRLLAHMQVLCIVNTRGHARKLFTALGEGEEHFHLSAQMCPVHRSKVLGDIRQRLDEGLPCRVVSTQLVEAGVDIDFPAVYRSLAGVDAIAQAAGRCNRNGRAERGEMYVFRSEHIRAEAYFRATADIAKQVLDLHDDPLTLAAVEHYFRLLYWEAGTGAGWDAKGVLDKFQISSRSKDLPFLFSFATVARDFKLIEDTGRPVIIPWGEQGEELCEELRDPYVEPGRKLLRRLQRYTVQAPGAAWERHVERGDIELVRGLYPLLVSPEVHYSKRLGLDLEGGQNVFLNT